MAIDKNDPTIKEIFSRLEFCEGRIGGGKVTKPGKSAPKVDKNKVTAETTPPAPATAAQEDASGDAPAPDAPPPGNTGTETTPPATETETDTAPPATAEIK